MGDKGEYYEQRVEDNSDPRLRYLAQGPLGIICLNRSERHILIYVFSDPRMR